MVFRKAKQIDYLFVAVSEIHEALVVVVVVSTFRGVGGKEEVVRAEAVALCVAVCENAALQHLVVAVVDTRGHDARGEGQLLVFIEKVVDVLVEDHAAHRLQLISHHKGYP